VLPARFVGGNVFSRRVKEALVDEVSNTPNHDSHSEEQLLGVEIDEQDLGDKEDGDSSAEWFVIHSYSGMENKVKRNLEHRAESMGMTDRILQVVVPTETEIEIKDGVRREVERRVFPGYVLIKMIMDEDSWYVVRNTPGVTSFVGMGNKPTPLSQDEVDRIMSRIESDAPRVKVSFSVGERVRITEGPFAEFTGVVDAIDADKGKARVMVSFFNRETPVEVDFLQLERET
jgi:transcriptional antiterminator NusG